MEPELENQGPILGQHLFEEGDPGQLGVETGAADLAVDVPENGIGVPGAEEDADPPPGGKLRQ